MENTLNSLREPPETLEPGSPKDLEYIRALRAQNPEMICTLGQMLWLTISPDEQAVLIDTSIEEHGSEDGEGQGDLINERLICERFNDPRVSTILGLDRESPASASGDDVSDQLPVA
jgi:hypothetical protein